MKIETLKKYIAMGREIEFSYQGELYSITYSFNNRDQIIYFCRFNQSCKEYHSAEDFLASAMIGDAYFRDTVSYLENIVVY